MCEKEKKSLFAEIKYEKEIFKMTKTKTTNKVSLYNRWLNGIEKIGNNLPHPIALFAALAGLIVVISAICSALGVSATGELIVKLEDKLYEHLCFLLAAKEIGKVVFHNLFRGNFHPQQRATKVQILFQLQKKHKPQFFLHFANDNKCNHLESNS